MPTKELADGTKLMWSLDYTGGDQVQLTALIPDAVSGVGMQWRSGNRLPATVNNNVLQVGGTRANLPITVSWTDPAGTAHEQSISG
jgi:hypothetical protein